MIKKSERTYIIKDLDKTYCVSCNGIVAPFLKSLYDFRFGIDKTYNIGICSSCALMQTYPLPSNIELKELYEKYYNFGGESDTKYTRLREKVFTSRLYRYWVALDGDISFHNKRGSGSLIDIGCNEGRGLTLYKHNGFTSEGLELNKNAAKIARSKGFVISEKTIEEFEPYSKFDVVVLSNVLEHSTDSIGMLSQVRRILNDSGVVWISCPNNRSWLRHVFGKYWINWHVPFHTVHYSVDSLKKALNGAGFNLISIGYETPSLWIAHSVIAFLFARPGKLTVKLRNPLLVCFLMLLIRGLLFPVLWLGNLCGYGDCLVVTAQKS